MHQVHPDQLVILPKLFPSINNLAISKVIDIENLSEEKVVFGSTVTIEDTETGERTAYKLVGPFESDIQQNKISVTSPIGKALIGKVAGDEVRVKTPGGLRVLQVVDIRIGVDA